MTVLADFILLGHEKVGSFALSSSKTHIFGVALGAWLDAIAEVLNGVAVPRLFQLNPDLRVEDLPQLVHDDVETPDLRELGEYVERLAGIGGLQVDDDLEAYFRRVAGMPARRGETG